MIPAFPDVILASSNAEIFAIDMPIGLLEEARRGGRTCDSEGRDILGSPRRSSIFSPPARPALRAMSYQDALRINRNSSSARIGISRQSFGLFRRLKEVDDLMCQFPDLQERIREVHPELCFRAMNNGIPMQHSKRTARGIQDRVVLLQRSGFSHLREWLCLHLKARVAPDDILDACASCWTAERIHLGIALRIPAEPETDSWGLRMEMWV